MARKIVYFILTLLILSICVLIISIKYQNEEIHQCTVEDKWVKRESKNSDVYLVQCGNNVYKVSDLLFKGKFNSSDIYAQLKVGEKYEIITTGYRINALSMYKNINEFRKLGD